MPFSSTGNRFADWASHIAENIDRITDEPGSPPDQERMAQPLIYDGVERCLERMSDAVSRFSRADVTLADLEPTVPWREVRAFGNITRHEYDNVDERIVRETILETLPELRAAALRLKTHFERQAS